MNDTATALGNQTNSIFSNTSPGVVILLAIVALLMVVTIIGLIYGAHQKRRRVHAETEVEQHAEEEQNAADAGDLEPPLPDTAHTEEASPPSAERPPTPAPPEEWSRPPAETPPPADAADLPDPAPLADEPIPAADAATATPAAEAEAGTEDAADPAMADAPVTVLKGLGPKVAVQLGELGIATVGDLAALDDRAAQDLDARLGAFTGRMTRDRWLEQARLLAAGDRKGFEERFGKL